MKETAKSRVWKVPLENAGAAETRAVIKKIKTRLSARQSAVCGATVTQSHVMLYYYHDSTLASARHFCLRELSGCVWWLNPAAVAAEDSGEPEMKREKAAGQQAASNKVKACGDNQRRDREEADSENAAQLKAPPERRRKRSPCSGQPRAKARQLKLGQRSLAGVADDELCEADTGDEQSTPCAAALVATGVDEDFRVATSCPWQKIAPGALWPVNFFVQIPCIAALQPRACAC
ncbi:unnamed protein product [Effrenium voratum]|nr:unnamed protein product [Effrenium voratum]